MKFAFEIKTKPVTQAAIIITVVAFSSESLVTVAVYAQSPPVTSQKLHCHTLFLMIVFFYHNVNTPLNLDILGIY